MEDIDDDSWRVRKSALKMVVWFDDMTPFLESLILCIDECNENTRKSAYDALIHGYEKDKIKNKA